MNSFNGQRTTDNKQQSKCQRLKNIIVNSTLLIVNCTLLIALFSSCDDKQYQPKPRGYFRIDFPEKEYHKLDTMQYYSFDCPVYSEITPDFYSPQEKHWVNVEFPSYKGTIHISYKTVNDNLDVYLEDSYSMMVKHISHAMGIRDSMIVDHDRKVYGLVYFLEGEGVASPLQFYVTDSTSHFMRGSLYFNVRTNNDSLAPVIDFITDDIRRLIETVEWKTIEN